jgi:hypothetical protein
MLAQTALRWLGHSDAPEVMRILKKQLKRRPAGFDGKLDGLALQGSAILSMTLRALASGAAQGFAERGDASAVPSLLTYIDDDLENEQSRAVACEAVAALIEEKQTPEIVKRMQVGPKPNKADELRLFCLLDALAVRTPDTLSPRLVDWIVDPKTDPLAAAKAAKALGRHGLGEGDTNTLVQELGGARGVEAAVALALGGNARGIAALVQHAKSAKGSWLPSVAALYSDAVQITYAWDMGDRYFRWVENAVALADAKLDFARTALHQRHLESEHDRGPKTLTRVVIRGTLYELARNDRPDRKRAIMTLEVLSERGILLALAEKDGDVGTDARAALARMRSSGN